MTSVFVRCCLSIGEYSDSCENSERLAATLEQAGADVTYLPVEGAEHSFVLRFGAREADTAPAAIEAFLAEAFETAH